MPIPRWEGDDRGEGVADATVFAVGATELAEAMRRPAWVSEEPEVHLLPHVQRACETVPLRLVGSSTSADGTLTLELSSTDADAGLGEVRAAVFAVLGSFAEPATYVRQRRAETSEAPLVFEVATGFLPSDTPFAPHGHTVRITVSMAPS